MLFHECVKVYYNIGPGFLVSHLEFVGVREVLIENRTYHSNPPCW